ncbi:MAG: NAD-dependent epimerase/dehydratase family protein [Actinobacteria bacterium]|nr:NAD-dependent epimerase/dehydratase family protein [Actinomycetota bacterium]
MDIVTGATGLLGNALVRELLNNGRELGLFVRKTSDIECFKDCCTEKFYGDVLDYDSIVKAFRKAENVYHAASEISIMPGYSNYLDKVNICGTKNIIKACIECGVKRLVYTSSIHAFKEQEGNTVIDEKLSFDPYSKMGQYNRTKARASIDVMNAAKDGLETVIVCPTAIIGPYDFKVSNLGSLFIDYCRKKQKIIIDGAYDFVDSRDVAIGHVLAAQKGQSGQVYILSGQRLTLPELMSMLEKITGIAAPRFRLPKWLAYSLGFAAPAYYAATKTKPKFTVYSVKTVNSNSYISHEKATRELGYNPRPINQTIADNIKWFEENNYF